jgi:hypothetical protein
MTRPPGERHERTSNTMKIVTPRQTERPEPPGHDWWEVAVHIARAVAAVAAMVTAMIGLR